MVGLPSDELDLADVGMCDELLSDLGGVLAVYREGVDHTGVLVEPCLAVDVDNHGVGERAELASFEHDCGLFRQVRVAYYRDTYLYILPPELM